MDILKIEKDFSKKDLEIIYNSLKNSEIVALPTDTVFGFSVLASDKEALKKIYSLKKRTKEKPFILLIANLNMLKKYCIVSNEQEDYLKKIWPGNITVVLEAKKSSLSHLSLNGSLAVRFPNSNFLNKFLEKTKEAIISTSANISGEKNCSSGEEIYKKWLKKKEQPDLVVFKKIKKSRASKIIDLRNINNIKILRK